LPFANCQFHQANYLNLIKIRKRKHMQNLNPWIEIPENSDFSIYNLPFGIFSTSAKNRRAGMAIGDKVVDLPAAANLGIFAGLGIHYEVFENEDLNDFIALGKTITNEVRLRVQNELCDDESILKESGDVFVNRSDVTMHMPVKVGDYTDFYSSREHAENVGKMFRGEENALLPNWKHLPVGYHGRSSSIVISGTDIHRPKGQLKPGDGPPEFGPCKNLDFELELAFITGKKTELGSSVSTSRAEDHIFGMVLFNDWSARDIQKWEYQPLGPFLGKNFASSVSPWIVTLEALEPFRVEGPRQDPPVLPYLDFEDAKNFDIHLEVDIQPKNSGKAKTVTRSNFKYMYWNMAQQLAHHTVNGCNLNVGDMMASGTISGPTPDSYGSLLELSWAGSKPVSLNDGGERTFLNDFDTVIMRGHAEKDGIRAGFGEVRGKILPAKD
jgi:fumarylacetoacetase